MIIKTGPVWTYYVSKLRISANWDLPEIIQKNKSGGASCNPFVYTLPQH